MNVIGIIPARGGSKGVKNKNIRKVNGKHLINYTIENAVKSELLDDFLVSTDSSKIAEIAEKAGAKVPFLRPKELATDTATSLSVVQHAVRQHENQTGYSIDAVILLQPTTPLRKSKDIDQALELFTESDSESLISCYEAKDAHPNYMYEFKRGQIMESIKNQDDIPHRRQDFDPVFLINGAIYISTRELIFEEGKIHTNEPIGYQMPRDRSINIDEPFDLKLAELIIKDLNNN